MRSPAPIFAAALGLAAGIVLLWPDRSGNGDRSGEPGSGGAGGWTVEPSPSLENAPVTLKKAPRDAFADWLSEPASTFEPRAIEPLFDASRGQRVELPFARPLRGEVKLRHRHPSGDLAIGVELDGAFEGATAFLSRSPGGRITGHLVSTRSTEAFRFETDEQTGTVSIRRIRLDDLLCVRTDHGLIEPGLPPDPQSAEEGEGGQGGPGESTPLLESLPGSSHVVFLNFDGETVTGTPWNVSYNDGDPIVAAPFGTPAHIPGIWASISEDYSIFDVNVTTDRAAYDAALPGNRVMIIFTPTKSWYGSAGGVAYVDSFGSSNPYAWVFNLTLNGSAESGSHEIGHTLGLRHDGTSSRAYYTGHTHASGVSWGPIMGTSYNRTIVQFSKGEYPNANRTENDFVLLAEHLDPLPDDHGDSAGSATSVVPPVAGQIDESGVVGNQNDVDLFRLETGGSGAINLVATPHPTYRNLDLSLELLDENLSVLHSSAPDGPFDATLAAPAQPSGVYFIRIRGTGLGNLTTGYGPYGSVGTYTLTGTYLPSPPPDTPTLLSAEDGASTASVTVTWQAAALADDYRLYRGLAPDGSDAVLVASPTGTSHADATAVPGTVYRYFVSAHNLSGESPRSTGDSGWRQLLPPDSPGSPQATDDSPHSIRVSWIPGERAQSYRISRNTANNFAGSTEVATTAALSWHDTSTVANTTHFYFIEAINTGGASAPAGTAAPGMKTTLPPGTPTSLTASDGTSPAHTLVQWTGSPDATGYRLQRNTVESVSGAVEIAVLGPTTSHTDATGAAGTEYWYFVRAILPGGDSAPSNLDAGHRLVAPPSSPASVTATLGSHPNGVLVSWLAAPDATGYRIYRGSEASPESADLLAETIDLSWLDETASPGRTYRYFVRAGNGTGLSDYSTPAFGHGAGADPDDDAYENNDDLSFAAPLPRGEIAAMAVDGDPDWYSLFLDPGDSRIDLAVPYAAVEGSVLLSLFDENGVPVASSGDGVSSRVLSHTGLPGAAYRVLVERDEGAAVPYRLLWSSLGAGHHGLSPDATIGFLFPPRIGEGVRESNGASQTLRILRHGASSIRVFSDVTNRSAVPGAFVTRGRAGHRFLKVDYFLLEGGGWRKVTGSMHRTGVGTPLAPFAKASFSVSVRIQARRSGKAVSASLLPIVSHVSTDRGTSDAVRIRVVRRDR